MGMSTDPIIIEYEEMKKKEKEEAYFQTEITFYHMVYNLVF